MSNVTTDVIERHYVILDSFILTLYSLTFLIGVIGNFLVLKILFLQRKKNRNWSMSVTNIYLSNLALSDFLSSLTIPLQFLFCSYYLQENFLISPHICVLLKSIQILTYNISILTMVVIAIDRYRLIHNPLQSTSKRLKPKYSLTLVWLLSILYALTCLLSMKVSEYFRSSNQLIRCRILFSNVLPVSTNLLRQIRVTLLTIGFYVIPLLITVPLYILCIRTISKKSTIGQSNQFQCNQSKQRTIKILFIILLVFALCWLPIHIMNIKDFYSSGQNSILNKPTTNSCNSSPMYTFFYWLAISSCCYNPFIYSWFNKNFRQSFFKCCKQQRSRKNSNVSQSSSIFYLSDQ